MVEARQIMVDDLSKASSDGDTSDSMSLREEFLKGANELRMETVAKLADSEEIQTA